jgi:hypothetical protein
MNDNFNLDVFVNIRLIERVENLRSMFNSNLGYESVHIETIENICKDLNPNFKYNKKESFFGLKEKSDGFEFILNFCFQYGVVETIIFAKFIDTGQKYGGALFAVFQKLEKNGLIKNNFDTRYPLFQNEDQLMEITKIYYSIYQDFKSYLTENIKIL